MEAATAGYHPQSASLYRDLKTGTLELTPAEGGNRANNSAIDSLLAGRKVRLSALLPEASATGSDNLADGRRRLKRIAQVALAYLEEKGANILFLAVGLAVW